MPRESKRLPIDDRVRVQHMLEAARDARQYVAGRVRSDLDSDSMLLRALTNAVQQIGEAAANVSEDGRARVPGLPWGQIVAMRHVLVHVYLGGGSGSAVGHSHGGCRGADRGVGGRVRGLAVAGAFSRVGAGCSRGRSVSDVAVAGPADEGGFALSPHADIGQA